MIYFTSFCVFIFIIAVILFFMLWVSYWEELCSNSNSSYECGFDGGTKTRLSFSYRFFLVAILFLLFDAEVSLLLPIPFLMLNIVSWGSIFVFILLLLMGLLYELVLGSLDWL